MNLAFSNEFAFFLKCETIFSTSISFTKKEIRVTECGK